MSTGPSFSWAWKRGQRLRCPLVGKKPFLQHTITIRNYFLSKHHTQISFLSYTGKSVTSSPVLEHFPPVRSLWIHQQKYTVQPRKWKNIFYITVKSSNCWLWAFQNETKPSDISSPEKQVFLSGQFALLPHWKKQPLPPSTSSLQHTHSSITKIVLRMNKLFGIFKAATHVQSRISNLLY